MNRTALSLFSIICALLCINMRAQNPELIPLEKHAIRAFVNDLQCGRKELVAAAMHYPMQREYPLMPIMSEEEFIERYDEFIDDRFIESVKNAEWERIGWRGICCDSGILWGNIDENGEFYAYSYGLTPKGQHVWKEAVEKQRERLYSGLQEFKKPVVMFKTVNYIIRVDQIAEDAYRYASWGYGHDISSKPDLIINGGILMVDGSLHSESYSFTNGDYVYEIGQGDYTHNTDFELTVFKKGSLLMMQPGYLIY